MKHPKKIKRDFREAKIKTRLRSPPSSLYFLSPLLSPLIMNFVKSIFFFFFPYKNNFKKRNSKYNRISL